MELAPVGLLRVERERVLVLFDEGGVETPQVPVAALHSFLLLGLALAHATLGLQTVVDTRSVSNDDRRAVPCLGLADGLQALCVVGAHGDLCHIHISVGGGDHAQVFLADALALGGKLCDGAERCGLRCLAAGVGVHLGVEHKDVDVLTRCDDVVETAVADVVGCAVATDDPLRALHQIVVEGLQFLAGLAALGSASGNLCTQLRCNLLRLVSVVAVGNPLLGQRLVFGRDVAGLDGFAEQFGDALLHLLHAEGHTQAELAEVLEEGVVEHRALSLLVLCIRSRGDGCGIDRRAASGVGNHLAVAEEL